jgi:AraC-like DNA-binding protein
MFPDRHWTFPDSIPYARCVKVSERQPPRPQGLRGRPGEAMVRVGVVAAVPAVLRELGADPAVVVAEAGLDPRLLDDPDHLIPYAARGRLLGRCVARTGCADFGLRVGRHGQLSALGLVGFLVQHAPDVGTALTSLVRYLHLHVRGAVVSLQVQGGTATLAYDIYEPQVEATDQIADGALAMMFNIVRTLCGARWRPLEVQLAHRAPADVRPFRRFFGVPAQFDAGRNALVFAASWLEHRSSTADPQLRRFLQRQIEALDARHRDDFATQVRSVLRTAVLTGHGSVGQVAALFSMHSRTLNRRLNEAGTRFRRLVDEVRFEVAGQMLRDTALRIDEIAAALAYADASAFTRAFRRWSGTTPAAWRAAQRMPGRRA